MTQALMKGADRVLERERAPRLQSESPKFLTLPSAKLNFPTHIADVRSDQAKNTKPVALGADGSTLIRNPGQLRKALKAVRRIVSVEYGRQGCTDPYTAQQLFLAYAAIENAASADDLNYDRTLDRWAPRRLPGLTKDGRAKAIAELRGFSGEITARFLGELLGLTAKQRDSYRFWLAEPVDLNVEDRDARRRAKDAERRRQDRREKGIPAKGEFLALAQKLRPDASPSTHTRLARKLKGEANG